MGQCTSRKSAGAYMYSTEKRPMASKNMSIRNRHRLTTTDDKQNQDDNKDHNKPRFSRGLATSFGFKRVQPSAIPVPKDVTPNSNKNTSQHIIDSNGNDDPLDSLETTELHPSGRSTPRLAPPKKEASTARLNRFGFRNQSNLNRTSRLSGGVSPHTNTPSTNSVTVVASSAAENKNNNVEKVKKSVSIAPIVPKVKQQNSVAKTFGPSKVNKQVKSPQQPNAPAKLTFHTTQLPRPQLPLRFAESKNAKTAANINRKVSSASQRSEEAFSSSKEGSVTEDSGVGSHTSGTNCNFTGDSDTLHGIELMDSSPTFGARKNKNSSRAARNLELIVSGKNFDVRDLDDSVEEDGVVTEVAVIPLPRLPSVFATNNSPDSRSTNSSVFGNVSTGMVRERTLEYERQIDKNRRKISITSSEGFSEDYGEEEKSFRDRSCTEKVGQGVSRLFSSSKSFREVHLRKPLHSDKDSSPGSSDDQDWEQGGEAMADVCSSIGFSSSDESRDKEISPILLRNGMSRSMQSDRDRDPNQMATSCTGAIPKDNSRSVLLTRDETRTLGESARHSINKNIPIETNSYQNTNKSTHGGRVQEKDNNVRSVLLTIEDKKFTPFKPYEYDAVHISTSANSNSLMMTSSSSLSSSSSGTITRPDFLKSSSLFLKEEQHTITTKTPPIKTTSDLISPILTNSILASVAKSSTPRDELKSVLLSLEDPKFAAVAAASSGGTLLDDETSPVDSLISSYTESEETVSKHNKTKTSKQSSTESKDINEKSPLSPESPGTPTNASLSLSEGRDFLIDDEIADQPALIFDEAPSVHSMRHHDNHQSSLFSECDRVSSSEHHNVSDNVTLVDSTPKFMRRALRSCEGSPAMVRAKLLSRTASVDTLSPCESIASDDLMMDFDQSQSSGIEDSTDRLNLNEGSALHSMNEAELMSELENQDSVVARQWSSLLGTHSNKDSPSYNSVVRTNNFLRSQTTTPNSVPDSPRSTGRPGFRGSLTNTNSPLLRSARTTHGSPAAYDSDDSMRISQGSMVNDIVGIKTMLLKLKRVLQETDEDNLMRNEPLNPFENQNSLKNGFYNGLSSEREREREREREQSDLDSVDSMDLNNSTSMEMAELRRQIEFLQSQLEDKDRTVHHLQNQISKYNHLDRHHWENRERVHETSNAATQTDRVRPLSAGPSLLQTLPSEGGMGPLVSVNERESRRSRPQSMVETHPPPSPLVGGGALRTPPLKLWRKPGEPPPPTSRYSQQGSSLPRRARSRSRPTAAAAAPPATT